MQCAGMKQRKPLGALGDLGSLPNYERDERRRARAGRGEGDFANIALIESSGHTLRAGKPNLSNPAILHPLILLLPCPRPQSTLNTNSTEDSPRHFITSLPTIRAMFALRDLAVSSRPSDSRASRRLLWHQAFVDPSALFRHEVAFVFVNYHTQHQIPALLASVGKYQGRKLVRHELRRRWVAWRKKQGWKTCFGDSSRTLSKLCETRHRRSR